MICEPIILNVAYWFLDTSIIVCNSFILLFWHVIILCNFVAKRHIDMGFQFLEKKKMCPFTTISKIHFASRPTSDSFCLIVSYVECFTIEYQENQICCWLLSKCWRNMCTKLLMSCNFSVLTMYFLWQSSVVQYNCQRIDDMSDCLWYILRSQKLSYHAYYYCY